MAADPEIQVVESEFNPQSVYEYYQLDKSSDKDWARHVRLKAKQHLAAMGWTFPYIKKGNRMELRYLPPNGKKKYISLKTACRGYLDTTAACSREELEQQEQEFAAKKMFNGTHKEFCVEIKTPVDKCGHGGDVEKKKKNMDDEFSVEIEIPVDNYGHGSDAKKKKKRRLGVYDVFGDRMLQCMQELSDETEMAKAKFEDEKECGTEKVQASKRVGTPSGAKTMTSWLIDNNVVSPFAKVEYRNKKDGTKMAEGRVTREGIRCLCCDQVFTLSKFEGHAGSNYHRPAANIFLENGKSLFQCREEVKLDGDNGNSTREKFRKNDHNDIKCATKKHLGEKLNDEVCLACRKGGELVLCDHCPSAFHTLCLGLLTIPDDEFWYCPSCCCKICGQNIDKANIKQCGQCEKKYHSKCIDQNLLTEPNDKKVWFCCKKCEEVHLGLKMLLGKPIVLGENNITCTLLKYDANANHAEINRKLRVALKVMHECFETVKEPQSGRNIIKDVIFSKESHMKRLDFRGFYTVLLEKDNAAVSAATVRVYGEKVAEIPLLATRFKNRGQGMCRILMNVLEKKLTEIGVEKIVLPAIYPVLKIWTSPSFGFSPVSTKDRIALLDYNFLEFPETVTCQKLLIKNGDSLFMKANQVNSFILLPNGRIRCV